MFGDSLHGEENAADIDVEDVGIVFAGDLSDWRGGEEGGAVDQDIDMPQLRHGFGHGGVDTGLVGDIQPDGACRFANLSSGFARAIQIDVRNHYAGAFTHICLSKGATDPPGGASDQGGFTCQSHQSTLRPCASNLCILSTCGDR